MRHLLAFEYRKLWRSKAFYICMFIMAALCMAQIAITKATMDFFSITSITEALDEATPEMLKYSGIKYLMGACSSTYIPIFFAILVTIFVCADFTEGTIKNIVSRGFTREKVFFSKAIVICTATVIFGIFSMLVNFAGGSMIFKMGTGFTIECFWSLLAQLLALIAYTMLNVLLAVLFGSLGGALTLGLVIPILFPLLAQLADLALKVAVKNPKSLPENPISRFTVGTNLSTISTMSPEGKDIVFAAVIFASYILLFTLLGILAIRRKEV